MCLLSFVILIDKNYLYENKMFAIINDDHFLINNFQLW